MDANLGLSCRTVPAPTSMASWMDRKPCVIVWLSDPLRNTLAGKQAARERQTGPAVFRSSPDYIQIGASQVMSQIRAFFSLKPETDTFEPMFIVYIQFLYTCLSLAEFCPDVHIDTPKYFV